jgi:photosystem II stability/assembly factor-like uncharacterized protein
VVRVVGARRVLGVAAVLGAFAVVPSACTFYTGCPDPPANNGTGNNGTGNNGTGGSSSNGGKSGAGGSVGQSGAGGEGQGPKPWQDAAGTLTGRSANCGVQYVSAHPTEDEVIVGIDQFGLWANTEGDEWVALGTSGQSAVINNGVTSIVYDPEDPNVFWEAGIYIGPGGYRTDDGGQTFVQLGDLKHVDTISVDFTDPDRKTLLAGPHEKGGLVFKSVDGGQTWAELANLPEGLGFSSSVLVLDADTYLVGCENTIIRTTDGGSSWSIVSKIGGHFAPLVAADGSIYWNAESNQGMVKSGDGGQTWERIVGGGVLNTSRSPIELPDGRLAALQGSAVVVSEDQGFSWTAISEDVPFTIKGLAYAPTRRAFYVSTDSCDAPILSNAILRLDFDYENE